MELNGALLNRSLLETATLVGRLAGAGGLGRASEAPPVRAGAVKMAVFAALAASQGPMRSGEIHAAAQVLTGTTLSWNTVKDCLHKQAREPSSPISRVGHGLYQNSLRLSQGSG